MCEWCPPTRPSRNRSIWRVRFTIACFGRYRSESEKNVKGLRISVRSSLQRLTNMTQPSSCFFLHFIAELWAYWPLIHPCLG